MNILKGYCVFVLFFLKFQLTFHKYYILITYQPFCENGNSIKYILLIGKYIKLCLYNDLKKKTLINIV